MLTAWFWNGVIVLAVLLVVVAIGAVCGFLLWVERFLKSLKGE